MEREFLEERVHEKAKQWLPASQRTGVWMQKPKGTSIQVGECFILTTVRKLLNNHID